MAEYKPTAAGGPRRRPLTDPTDSSPTATRRRQYIDPNAPPVTSPVPEVSATPPQTLGEILNIGPGRSVEEQQLAKAFEELAETASTLNAASDALGKPIAALDAAFKELNIGVTVWVQIDSIQHEPHYGWEWGRAIGYAKIGGRWGIAIREYEGDMSRPDYERDEQWLFGEAPRTHRVQAVNHLPELVEALSNAAAKTAKAMESKVAAATQVANVAEAIVKARKARR